MRAKIIRILLSALFVVFLSPLIMAQSGRFSGQITDPQGAAIPGASVQIINQETLVKREAVSDSSGMFSVAYLPAGKYQVQVSADNFNTSINKDVALGVDQSVSLNVQLTIGSTTSDVLVQGSSAATEINTATSEVSGTITGEEVKTLALNGRNFTQLITLTPGVSNQSQQDEALVGAVGQAKYSFNGGRTEYNSFEVDGSDVLNLSVYPTSAPLIVTPSLDAIQEIKVLTSNYGAQYGRTASGVVIASTKSGTNSFHGDAYEFVRNELFNSRNYFDPPGNAPLYRRNDFGFTLGGPVYVPHFYNTAKTKTFFFFSEEVRIDRTPTSYRVGAPDAKELAGDFSEFCPSDGAPPNPKLYPNCPQGYTGTAGSGTPSFFKANFGDANMYAILAAGLIPAANSTTGCSSSTGTCYVASVSPVTHWREELFRIDHDFSEKHRLTLRYVHDAWDTSVLSPQWGYLGSQNSYPTIQNTFTGPGINVLASVASTLTSSLFNIANFSWTDSRIALTDKAGQGSDLRRPVQLDATTCAAGFNQGCPVGFIFKNGFGGKIPGIAFSGVGSDLGGGNLLLDTGYMPWEHTSPTYNLTDSLTKILGKHTIQIGSQFIWLQRNQDNSAVGSATGDTQGLISFRSVDPGNTAASILRGQQITSYQQDSAQGRFHQAAFVAEPYVQDDWKLSPRVTLNVGVRLSLFGNFYERNRALYNWEPSKFNYALTQTFHVDPAFGTLIDNSTGQPFPRTANGLDPRIVNGLVRCGYGGIPASCMSPQLWNPAPRVGGAWDITGRGTSALRAGYGVFFEHGTPYEANTGSLEANPPAVTSDEEYYPPGGLDCIGGGNSALLCGTPVLDGAFPISVTSIPTKTHWAYAQQWNLSFQQQFPKGFVATIGYVGSRATHLTAERQLNQLQPVPSQLNPYGPHQPFVQNTDCSSNTINGTVLNVNNLAVVCAEATAGGGGALRSPAAVRVVAPGIDKIASIEPVADSSYHGFQFLGRRTAGPLTLDVAYTYSHSIDDSSDRTDIPVDGLDIHANKASSSFDQRQLLEISYVYQLPVASWWKSLAEWLPKDPKHDWKGADSPITIGKVGHALLDKWSLSGLAFSQSGIPFSVYSSGYHGISATDNAGVANGLSSLYASYPDLVGNAKHGLATAKGTGGDNAKSFGPLLLNPAAFAAPRGLTFGSAGRNVLNNPHRTNFDLSALKHFPLPHERDIEFRAEAFNVFNHTQFRIYDPSQGNSPSNTVSCYAGESARYSAGGGGGTDCFTGYSFLHPFNAHRARTMQFALKLVF
jgi:hypothetical protein